MGGKAFSGPDGYIKRMDRKTYLRVREEIMTVLDLYGHFRFKYVKELPDKQSFGDIDFLIESHDNLFLRLEKLFKEFKSEIKQNGNVISVLYKGEYQIDFIVMEYRHFKTASLFYDYNDIGNLIGRLFRYYGFKLTPKGLFYPIKHDQHGVIGEVFVSDSPIDILSILGLSIHEYNAFENRNDLFSWIGSSPYFLKKIYSLDYLSNASRRRDKKRPTYIAFLEWLEGREFPVHDLNINVTEIDSSIAFKIAEIITTYNQNQEITTKFNGRKFLDRGVEPKRIGEFKKFINWGYSREYLLHIEDEVADLIIDALIDYDAKYSLKIMHTSMNNVN